MNCPNCSNAIPQGTTFCPFCGAQTTGGAAPQPGAAIAGATAVPTYSHLPKSKTMFVVMAILFGSFGIHNFIAGYTGKGVAQALVSVLSCFTLSPIMWIWAVIEACTVNVDSDGVPFA